MTCTRRNFLAATAGALALPELARASTNRRPRIAALATNYQKYSHAQHIVDRFLEGYGWEGRHHRPAMDIVSLYVEQIGDNDLSRERVRRHEQLKSYPTIAEALTCGTDRLAVDGVLLIAEYGTFPRNEKGQVLYPRYEYFQQIVDVFRDSNRTAPVFNDKHLSWNWTWAKEMVDTAREMDFGFMAGSSLPFARRLPSIDLPWGAGVQEVLAIRPGSIDGGDIHILEAMQAIIERRRGGETGVRSVEAFRGERFFTALEAGSWEAGGWDHQLMAAALARSDTIEPVRPDYGVVFPTTDDMRRQAPDSYAYRFEYADGLKATIIKFQAKSKSNSLGVMRDDTFAARLAGGKLLSLQIYLPYYSMRNFFNPQVRQMESLFLTGRPSFPIERTLLTTGMTAAGVESLFQQQRRLETPHLDIHYTSPRESLFWQT